MNINQKTFLAIGLALVIVIFLFWGIVRPLAFEIKETSALVKDRNEKLAIFKNTDQEYLEQLENEYNTIKENLELIKNGFLSINEAVDFFIELESIALSTFNDLEIEARDFPIFDIYLLGDFPNLMRFLGWLENSNYLLNTEFLQIRRITEQDVILGVSTFSVGDVKSVIRIRNYTEDKIYEENLKTN